jgi:hypothetical protein
MMPFRFTLLLLFTLAFRSVSAQCPGCLIDLPANLPADTIFLGSPPDGEVGLPYDEDISFRMPMTTTPVAAVDPTTPPGLPITSITVLSVSNLPPGLSWEANQLEFNTGTGDTDGCVKFCGTPTLPDSFFVQVTVAANIFGITQSTSFSLVINIQPSSAANQGFTILNNVGCGQTTASFINNVPSNGQDGFSYFWDFGNGNTSTLENPPPQTYAQPGSYEVNYSATVDTFGYFLTAVTVLDTDCDDFNIPPNNKPDLYIEIKSPGGTTIYTSPVASNVDIPHTFYLNLELGDGNYGIEVLDDELIGTEECGSVNFSKTTTGILIDGQLELSVTINHPVQNINTVEIVDVFPVPDTPELIYETLDYCAGDMAELEVANYADGLQWYQDTLSIPGAGSPVFTTNAGGLYWVVYTSPDGCTAQIDPVEVVFHPLPAPPTFENEDNLISVLNPDALPNDYALQWLVDGQAIPGATGLSYCLEEPGTFSVTLVVTNLETGCTRSFTRDETFDPDGDCLSATADTWPAQPGMRLYPNPVSDLLTLESESLPAGLVELSCINGLGQVLKRQMMTHAGGIFQAQLPVQDLQPGWYILLVRDETGKGLSRMPFIRN